MKVHVFVLVLLPVIQYSIARSVVKYRSQQRHKWTAEKGGGFSILLPREFSEKTKTNGLKRLGNHRNKALLRFDSLSLFLKRFFR